MAKRNSDFTTDRSVSIRHSDTFGVRGRADHDLERGTIRDRPAARQAITQLLSPGQADRGVASAPRTAAKEPRGRRVGKDSIPPERPAPDRKAAQETPAAANPLPETPADPAGRPAWPLPSAAALGPLVRQQRQRLGFSQQRLADLAGVGRRFVSELESGKPSLEIDRVITCCTALGIDLFARSRS